MGIEAADPIDSARRGKSKPRPPPACAVRQEEIAVAPGNIIAVDCRHCDASHLDLVGGFCAVGGLVPYDTHMGAFFGKKSPKKS